jgi:hypothetical protein
MRSSVVLETAEPLGAGDRAVALDLDETPSSSRR